MVTAPFFVVDLLVFFYGVAHLVSHLCFCYSIFYNFYLFSVIIHDRLRPYKPKSLCKMCLNKYSVVSVEEIFTPDALLGAPLPVLGRTPFCLQS